MQVTATIEEILDKGLPEQFSLDAYREKCRAVCQHIRLLWEKGRECTQG